jgi:hypothetical protein
MCLQSCLQWAMEKYDEGYSPLELCGAHKSEIEKRVKAAMDAVGGIDAAIGELDEVPDDDWKPYVLGQDGEVIPPPPIPQPLAPQPLQRLRRPLPPQPQPAPQPPPPQRPQAARAQQPIPAPRRGALAQPVAPLPIALALGSDPYQAGDVRIQRQWVLQTLQRTTREETADALTRRIKVSMWLISVCLSRFHLCPVYTNSYYTGRVSPWCGHQHQSIERLLCCCRPPYCP